MRAIGKRMAFCLRVLSETFQIVHFKREMGKVGPDHYRPALVKFTNLNLLVAVRCFQKHELRSATGSVTAKLLKSQHILIKRNRFLQILYAVARVQQFLDHGLSYCGGAWIQTLALDKAVKTA